MIFLFSHLHDGEEVIWGVFIDGWTSSVVVVVLFCTWSGFIA